MFYDFLWSDPEPDPTKRFGSGFEAAILLVGNDVVGCGVPFTYEIAKYT